MTGDHFCLKWNNFQLNIASALESLKTNEDLVDVTLSCEGQNVKAHKVVLSACSPYFRAVFKENPCQHPIVILKDVSYDDLGALLSFMYQGEVYITQDRLASFLNTAELLQVRGLTGATNPLKNVTKVASNSSTVLHQPPSTSYSSTPQYRTADLLEQSASYQLSSTNISHETSAASNEHLQHTSDTDPPNLQSSSQPPSAKRRKAFPRRVSAGHISMEEPSESQDSEKAKSQSSEELGGCEIVSVDLVSVKQEPEEESIFSVDATMEEESNPISFTNTEEGIVRLESPSSDGTRRMNYYGNMDTIVSEDPQRDLKEESIEEDAPIMKSHSMLLQSLSGGKQQMITDDASPSRVSDVTRPVEESDDFELVGCHATDDVRVFAMATNSKYLNLDNTHCQPHNMLKIMQCISFVTFILSIQHLVFSNGQRNEAEGRIIYHPIVGGDPAEESELPHLAAVGFIRRFKQYWLCGGTLITKRYVLTAAHCLEDKKYRSYGKPVNVRLGDLDLKSSVDDSHAQNIDIMRRIPHPEYKHPMKYNDIALLELKQDAVFNNFVKPACLHRTHDIKETKAVVSGWGTAERNVTVPGQQKLRKVEIDLHPLDKCKVFLEGKDVSSILSEGLKDDSMICSGVLAGGKDSCDGDSGGPLQLAATSAECSAEIIGVVSFAFSSECGQKEVPAIYTRVSKYVPWIESITNSSG